MRSEIVVAGENGKEAAEPSVLMMQAVHHHHHHPQDPCSRSVIIHPPTQQQQQQVADPPAGMFAPPLPIQNTSSLERREFREPELDIGLFFFVFLIESNFIIWTFKEAKWNGNTKSRLLPGGHVVVLRRSVTELKDFFFFSSWARPSSIFLSDHWLLLPNSKLLPLPLHLKVNLWRTRLSIVVPNFSSSRVLILEISLKSLN